MNDSNPPLPEDVRKVVDDPARLDALAALDVMDSAPDADFERLSRVAAHIFGSEVALVTLVDKDRQWFRACFGIEGLTETSTESAFCARTIALPSDEDTLVVLDATKDPRFAENPLVTGWPGIRFYAGAAIVVGGQKLGSVCVIDTKPRASLDPGLEVQLVDLAGLASTLFELKNEARVRARTAAALMREEWRHALTLEAGKVGSWVWDVRTGEVTCNDMFRRMYDLPESAIIHIGDVLAATHEADRALVQAGIDASFSDGVDFSTEARAANTGRWLTMRGRVYQRDADGKPLVMMGASIDISESKQTAEHTRLLLRELNHRVKNTLAMIQSVARQTIRQNPDPKDFIEAFSGRLRTISDAHVLLADRDWTGVQLFEVIASQLGPKFRTQPDRAEVHGDDVMLPADHAVGLGLILHELTTNAHRYGAWSGQQGVVNIDWRIQTAPVRGLALTWREEGGPEVSKPDEIGLGTRLIERSLAKVLDSEVKLDFAPDGVTAKIWMPLPTEQI
ncbi:Two-component sensor histidine kinase, contains HisKA and HATPase domains [Devosia sp. YR412]|uniref:sensor histidine kinase n=1 Tax=Devosia sp. YR412 TaxID=1881030 RepID=UPI0008AC8F26|nr:HWE histidine kinase domain-containing protein [Devosia sp. YR412]SEQ08042.1 Two-component sensor histidine kinase, contains HisKA and HATPase domains [Devosia sp. YR412]